MFSRITSCLRCCWWRPGMRIGLTYHNICTVTRCSEIESPFFSALVYLNGILIYMQYYRGSVHCLVIKYFIYGVLIAEHKTIAVMWILGWERNRNDDDEKEKKSRSAEVDKIYWFLTDRNLCCSLKMRKSEGLASETLENQVKDELIFTSFRLVCQWKFDD